MPLCMMKFDYRCCTGNCFKIQANFVLFGKVITCPKSASVNVLTNIMYDLQVENTLAAIFWSPGLSFFALSTANTAP